MIRYRAFRNPDPPQILELWNQCFEGRGALPLPGVSFLEYFVFAKPYFDANLFWLAEEEGRLVGLAIAGFAANEDESTLDYSKGVICAIGAHPERRRMGIGTALLKRCEETLQSQGATTIYAGPQVPLNPYTFGIYGGCQSPGFLESDSHAGPFFTSHGYQLQSKCQVLQCPIEQFSPVVDRRFPTLRRRFDVCLHVPMRGTASWYQECALGPVELMELTVTDKENGEQVGSALAWEMELFSAAWNEHVVGVYNLAIEEPYRRQGLGRFFLSQILEYFHEQFFTLVEVQIPGSNPAAEALCKGLGFEPRDSGHLYQRLLN